jgi:hypothetical protein
LLAKHRSQLLVPLVIAAVDFEQGIGLRNTAELKGSGVLFDDDCAKGIKYGLGFEDKFELDFFGKVKKLAGYTSPEILGGCYLCVCGVVVWWLSRADVG